MEEERRRERDETLSILVLLHNYRLILLAGLPAYNVSRKNVRAAAFPDAVALCTFFFLEKRPKYAR